MSLLNETDAARFDSRVYHEPNTGCWLWGGATSERGYGNAYAGVDGVRRQWGAHRLSWARHNGRVPDKMEFVCHKCDVPACVNPEHLFLGTPKENTQDMMRKGRRVAPSVSNRARGERHGSKLNPDSVLKGANHPAAKLSEADVFAIRDTSLPGTVMAAKYGVSNNTISRIRSRLIWRHV